MNTNAPSVALTGPVQLELLAPYFEEAGYRLSLPGEIPDLTYDVTSHDEVLKKEVPGFYDERMQKLAGCPYSVDGIKAIVEEFGWWRQRGMKKILAVDADNTLWEGILSEDGKAALKPYEEFQDFLRKLSREGVIVVVLSKNDPGSIETDFATVHKINWGPKAGNLIEACRELNLPPDSVVFVDDNVHERAQMKAHLPEVTTVEFTPPPTAQFMRRLKEYFFTSGLTTREDELRVADYRRQLTTRDEYLGDLGLWVEARGARAEDLDRLAQMAGKTNQFNATTIRRPRSDFEGFLSDDAHQVFVFRAGDRYGEQGIVCYVIVEMTKLRITDFVMSCRAMGRTLENFAYEWVARQIGRRLPVDFTATPKNAPFAEFLKTVESGATLKTYFKEITNG